MKLAHHSLQSLLAVRPLDRVYAGSRKGQDRAVLVRQLLPGLPAAEQAETARVFAAHMERLTQLSDVGTLPVREYSASECPPFYFVTDIPVGVTLAEFVRSTGTLDVPVAAAIAAEIARLLEHAHARSVQHLSLHPGQVLLAPGARVSLLDLGLVALLLERVHGRLRHVAPAWDFLFPAPGAVAPELLVSEPTGPHTDVYALGVLLYFMTTAVLPFTGSSIVAYNAIVSGGARVDPREHMPELNAEFCALTNACLSRDPALRPPSALAVAQALQAFAVPLSQALQPFEAVIHPRRYVERFEPLLRVVDGGRGREEASGEPPSPAVVPLFLDSEGPLSEAELLSRMSNEQRRIYLAGAIGTGESGPRRREQLKRGVLVGVFVAIVAIFFLPLANPYLNPPEVAPSASPASSAEIPPRADDVRRPYEPESSRAYRRGPEITR